MSYECLMDVFKTYPFETPRDFHVPWMSRKSYGCLEDVSLKRLMIFMSCGCLMNVFERLLLLMSLRHNLMDYYFLEKLIMDVFLTFFHE